LQDVIFTVFTSGNPAIINPAFVVEAYCKKCVLRSVAFRTMITQGVALSLYVFLQNFFLLPKLNQEQVILSKKT